MQFVGKDRKVGFAVIGLGGERFEKAGQKIGRDARQDGVDAGRDRSGRGADLRRRRRARRHRHIDLLDQIAELRIEAVARLLEVDRDLANDAARIGREQQDAVAHQHRFLDIVGHQDDALDRQLAVAPQFEEIGAQRFGGQHVERGERLVHQQDVGMHDQRAGKADALAHAAGQFARIGGFVAVEADEIDRRQRALADLGFGKAERLEAELDVLQHRQPGKQREAPGTPWRCRAPARRPAGRDR